MTDRLLRIDQVKDKICLSRTTIWRKERDGEFPQSVLIHGNCKAWSEKELDDWIDARKSERKPALSFLSATPHPRSPKS